tara:strand:+ start:858 stop:1976 length:1119 start_codon:yes stop_codon:yes gene_type:complete
MRLDPNIFLRVLKKNGIDFFSGVPDSLLKDFLILLESKVKKNSHVIAANEGNAVGIAVGYHLATGNIPLVYMQNSGLGNCINPLTSLTNIESYSIPMILMIGWRGDPDEKDEPQHLLPGKILIEQLKIMGIDYEILNNEKKFFEKIDKIIHKVKKKSVPFALVVKKNFFKENNKKIDVKKKTMISRSEAIETILKQLGKEDIVFSTTGKISRELIAKKNIYKDPNVFFNVGSMGHVSSIAFGAALKKKTNIICIDGDGSFLMHLGSHAVVGSRKLPNYKYILINNGVHESVGSQPTVAFDIDIKKIAKSFGFNRYFFSNDQKSLEKNLKTIISEKGSFFLEVHVNLVDKNKLPRPEKSLVKLKKELMKKINN